jgi:hypothetical protein
VSFCSSVARVVDSGKLIIGDTTATARSASRATVAANTCSWCADRAHSPKEESMHPRYSRRPFAFPRAAVVTALAAVLAVLAPAAAARAAAAVPYSARGTAVVDLATGNFVGAGTASYLGAYTEAGALQLTPTGSAGVFIATATSTYTAANGDQLTATFSGQLNFATGAVSADVTYTGGTGRFAGATGTAVLIGRLNPADGTLEVIVKGTIDF